MLFVICDTHVSLAACIWYLGQRLIAWYVLWALSKPCETLWHLKSQQSWCTVPQVGWFPTYTITEDYALSCELKMAGFKGRYLPEYLAVSATSPVVLTGSWESLKSAKGPHEFHGACLPSLEVSFAAR